MNPQDRSRPWTLRSGLVALAALAALAALVAASALATPVRAQQSGLPSEVESAVEAAAAAELGVAAASLSVERAESVTWRDSCLGLGGATEACLLVLTPGYVVWIGDGAAGSSVLRYHTDDDGSNVRLGESGIDAEDVALAPLPEGTIGAETSQFFGQEIPTNGGIALLSTTTDATRVVLVEDLELVGCEPVTIARTVSGSWQVFIPGAPPAVNDASGFPPLLEANSLIFVRCDEDGVTPGPGGAGFSTDAVDETDRTGNALLVDVRVGEHAGYDRVVFEFSDAVPSELTAASGVPAYSVSYLAGVPTECGSGMPAAIEGAAMLEVALPGTHVIDPESGMPLVDSLELTDDLQVLAELEEICAFEGNSTWIAGLTSEAGFRVSELSSPTRLVIDIETTSVASPALSQTCDNPMDGYSVDYPAGWATNGGEVVAVCSYFDPLAFAVPEGQGFLDAAISLDVEAVSFEVASEPSEQETLVSSGSTTVAGRNAMWVRTTSVGGALLPDGTTSYVYVIDLGGSLSFIAVTRDLPGQDFEANRDILDRMVETLTFS